MSFLRSVEGKVLLAGIFGITVGTWDQPFGERFLLWTIAWQLTWLLSFIAITEVRILFMKVQYRRLVRELEKQKEGEKKNGEIT